MDATEAKINLFILHSPGRVQLSRVNQVPSTCLNQHQTTDQTDQPFQDLIRVAHWHWQTRDSGLYGPHKQRGAI
jgi:hypothetical protein